MDVQDQERDDPLPGVDSPQYALPGCEYCGGSGYVAVVDGGRFPRQDICGCVLETRRRHAVDVRLQSAFGAGALSMTFRNYSPGASAKNQAAYAGCLAYINHFDQFRSQGVGFALQGTYGCGKSHLATATLIALVKRWSALNGSLLMPFSISTPELFRLARKRMDREGERVADSIERAMRADVFLLDDIGAEYHRDSGEGMSWVDEQLYIILDHRLENNLPTLYTTNLRRSDLARLLDPRIVRRLDTKTATIWQLEAVEGTARPSQDLRDLLTSVPQPIPAPKRIRKGGDS